MTPDATAPNTPSPNPAQAGIKKPARKSVERFPLRFHCAITIAMNNSLKRLTGGNSLMAESDIGRLALHSYLLANDPNYQRELGGNRPHA